METPGADPQDGERSPEGRAFRFGLRKKRRGFWGELSYGFRRRVFAGLLVMSPIVISFLPIFIVYPYIKKFADQLTAGGLLGETPSRALSVVVAIVIVLSTLYLVGLLSATFVVRWGVKLGEKVVSEIPVISFLYRTTKQVADLIATSNAKPFQKPVIIEYPRKGIYTMGFVTGEGHYDKDRRHLVHIFMPTTPNPTSGFLLLLPAEDVQETDLSVDDAVKFIISGGIVDIGRMILRPYRSQTEDEQDSEVDE